MDIIDELSGKSDDDLSNMLGYDDKVAEFKKQLSRASGLKGKPRDKVVEHLNKMFQPSTYMAEDLGWILDDAERKEKTGASPGELVACACGDPD